MVNSKQLHQEVDWFYKQLGLDDFFFLSTPAVTIASHIQSIYAGKILAVCAHQEQVRARRSLNAASQQRNAQVHRRCSPSHSGL